MSKQSSRPSLSEQGYEQVATYPYKNELGKLVYEVRRWEHPEKPKEFRQWAFVDGRFRPSMTGIQRIPYQLDRLVRAKPGSTLYVVEGEKDVETLLKMGKLATTNNEGHGKHWGIEWRKWFVKFDKAVIIADKEDGGREHARRIYDCLSVMMECKIFEAARGKDVTDHLAAGLSLRDLKDITVAVLAEAEAKTNGNGKTNESHANVANAGTHNGWSAEDMAQWGLDLLRKDVPKGAKHSGRETAAHKLALQLRDVPRDMAEEAMTIFAENVPGYDSDGKAELYTIEQALNTLKSALDNPPPEDWTPSVVFARPKAGETLEDKLEFEIERQRIFRQAKRIVDQEEWDNRFEPPPFAGSLHEELAIDEEPLKWTIEDIHALGSNTTIIAQKKTGKTVVQLNLARSLADGVDFLGKFRVSCEGNIAIWNYELSRDMFRDWCRDLGFRHASRVFPLTLRGHRMPLWVSQGEDWAIEWLKRHEITTWLVDPFGRAFRGAGEGNSNDDVDVFLGALDHIKQEAGVQDLFLSLHMGHVVEEGQEHARGASALEDWPDHRWVMTKDGDQRFFKVAEGRQPKEYGPFAFEYNPGTREVTLTDITKEDTRIQRAAMYAVRALQIQDRQTTRELRANMRGKSENQTAGINYAIRMGWIGTEPVGNSTVHFLKDPPRTDLKVVE